MEGIFRFYAELNDFLPPGRRGVAFNYPFAAHQSLKDLVEALGVPHGEVDLILVNSQSVGFSQRLQDQDRVSVFPVFEAIDIEPLLRVRPQPLRETRFAVDVPLGRLASHLRLFGFDAVWRNDFEDSVLVELSVKERRLLLTRDHKLLMRKALTHGYFVRNTDPTLQLIEVLRHFDLARRVSPWVRCLKCNGKLEWVEKKSIDRQLEPKTCIFYDEFSRCPACGQIYWKGSHYESLQHFIHRVLGELKRPWSSAGLC